jgi:hypothetical protein
VTLKEAQTRKARQEEAHRKLCSGKLPDATAGNRWKLLERAISKIGADTPVVLLEFGVAKGASMAFFASRFVNKQSVFFGFDSFEGLPEDWTPGPSIVKGTFATGGAAPTIDDCRIRFIKGWFQNTVHQFLRGTSFSHPVLVHFDSDLYSSTLFLLATLWSFLPEYFFIMDDFAFDESFALYDFSRAFPVQIEWLAARLNQNRIPVQMFGRMKRVEFRVE